LPPVKPATGASLDFHNVVNEGIGDVLEEDWAEYKHVLLDRVYIAVQGVGHPPQLGFLADVRVVS
jgi:hypothetical protein